MRTDLYFHRDEPVSISVNLYTGNPSDEWGVLTFTQPGTDVKLFLSREQLHDVSRRIVDALHAADSGDSVDGVLYFPSLL